jgi:3-ketosteroid 9alpha-monooxygenase subunit B
MRDAQDLSYATNADVAGIATSGGDDEGLPDGFVPLQVKRVIHETRDAISIVLAVPAAQAAQFDYRAGQFLTVLVCVDGRQHQRCYSMSSSPAAADDLRITVKRDGDGVVSNWINDTAAPGQTLYATPPRGRFVLEDTDRELIAFAGGSGITPVFSLLRSALIAATRPVRLFYANRNRESVIFDAALTALQERYPQRLTVHHHLDDVRGIVTPAEIESFLTDATHADVYICGPGPFMDAVNNTVRLRGLPAERVHLEHFNASSISHAAAEVSDDVLTQEVTFELDRRTTTVAYSAGDTLLQTARMAGLRAPSSCEVGSCGTCMARLTDGSARMLNNDALEDDELKDGWVLTCQALPTARTVRVVYE